MSGRAVRRAHMRAAFVACVASLSMLAQAAVVAHALLVPHTTCSEHGTVAHEAGEAGHGHRHAATNAGQASLARSVPGASVSGDDAHALEDEHCSVLGTHHTPASRIFGAEPFDRRIPDPVGSVERPGVFAALAPYRLAPKTSPPTA